MIFRQWLSRDEVSQQESVSATNNIELQTHVTDTDNTPQTLDKTVGGWKGLKLRLGQGLESAGRFYSQLVSSFGEAVGIADGEPYWNACVDQWQVWVNFESGCKSVVCDLLLAVV
ncbi:hypothetical protein [Nostoc sp.]|uniref:hypothetical protein n=1 Tax=Nostoc sp. TaxID=1180 RepID=UPI002FFA29F4